MADAEKELTLDEMTEYRSFELRALVESPDKMELHGTPIVFERPTVIEGLDSKGNYKKYIEVVDSHALDNTNMKDTALKHMHKDVLARVRNKSLQLIKTDHGLDMRAVLSDTQKSRDVYTEVKDGLLPEMSFAFPSKQRGTISKWSQSPDGTPIRRIMHIPKLVDISTAYNGVYGDMTRVSARSLDLVDTEIEALDNEKKQLDGEAEMRAKIKIKSKIMEVIK